MTRQRNSEPVNSVYSQMVYFSALYRRRVGSLFLSFLLASTAHAQLPCKASNIYGTWWECGAIRSPTYSAPPASVNIDSLKTVFPSLGASRGSIWRFGADGCYSHEHVRVEGTTKGRYQVVEQRCDLKLSTLRRNPLHIVYLDDSCMILWHNNPKTAYLTIYRRPGKP